VAIEDASRIAFGPRHPMSVVPAPAARLFRHCVTTEAWAYMSLASCPTRASAIDPNASVVWCAGLACAICSPNPIHHAPTARPSDSSRPACASGRMPAAMTPQSNVPLTCYPAFITTTGADLTPASATFPHQSRTTSTEQRNGVTQLDPATLPIEMHRVTASVQKIPTGLIYIPSI